MPWQKENGLWEKQEVKDLWHILDIGPREEVNEER